MSEQEQLKHDHDEARIGWASTPLNVTELGDLAVKLDDSECWPHFVHRYARLQDAIRSRAELNEYILYNSIIATVMPLDLDPNNY